MVSKRKGVIDSQLVRRAVLRIGAGSLLAVGLVACGGGGGDSNESDLRSVFDALRDGLAPGDVVKMVGRNPNEISSDMTYIWVGGNEDLWVDFTADGVIYWATYHQISPSLKLRKDFS